MATPEVYKLEWTRAKSTIQAGISSVLQKESFMDTVLVCKDGAMEVNKLTIGLVMPDLHHVPVFDVPIDHTLLLPDYSLAEIQELIISFFPDGEINELKSPDNEGVGVDGEPNSFGHLVGMPRGGFRGRARGRPPLTHHHGKMPIRFQCDYCNKGFYYKSMLTAHEKLHTGGTRETCTVCGAEYSTRQNLKNHMVKYHGPESFVPRKRGRPAVEKDGLGTPPKQPRGVDGGMGRGAPLPHGMVGGQFMEDSNSSQEYGMIEQNMMAQNMGEDAEDDDERPQSVEPINAEHFLEQNLSDEGPEIVESSPEAPKDYTDHQPKVSKEYIEDDIEKKDIPKDMSPEVVVSPPFKPERDMSPEVVVPPPYIPERNMSPKVVVPPPFKPSWWTDPSAQIPKESSHAPNYPRPAQIPKESLHAPNYPRPTQIPKESLHAPNYPRPAQIPKENLHAPNYPRPDQIPKESLHAQNYHRPAQIPKESLHASNFPRPDQIPKESLHAPNYPRHVAPDHTNIHGRERLVHNQFVHPGMNSNMNNHENSASNTPPIPHPRKDPNDNPRPREYQVHW